MRYILILTLGFLSSCVSIEDKKQAEKVEKVSFSIASSSVNGGYNLVGSSPSCSIKWTVQKGILTHRMNCKTETQDELWAYLLGMASKLKAENTKDIYYVRYTSKDFPGDEVRLGRIFSKSKMWKKLNTKNIKQKKYKEFSNKFLARVIEKKGVLSLVPKALNAAGYSFKVDKVEIDKYRLQKNKVLRPIGSRIVFKTTSFTEGIKR